LQINALRVGAFARECFLSLYPERRKLLRRCLEPAPSAPLRAGSEHNEGAACAGLNRMLKNVSGRCDSEPLPPF
jgi:hypothetical protein